MVLARQRKGGGELPDVPRFVQLVHDIRLCPGTSLWCNRPAPGRTPMQEFNGRHQVTGPRGCPPAATRSIERPAATDPPVSLESANGHRGRGHPDRGGDDELIHRGRTPTELGQDRLADRVRCRSCIGRLTGARARPCRIRRYRARSMTSSTPAHTSAPSLRSWFVPSEARLSTGPGTAITVRSRSRASRTVCMDPPAPADSTTTTTSARPARILLRTGKRQGAAAIPGGTSDRMTPRSATRHADARLRDGQGASSPAPTTAAVGARPGAPVDPSAGAAGAAMPPTAPTWAAASMPIARPDTTQIPRAASPRPRSAATRRP